MHLELRTATYAKLVRLAGVDEEGRTEPIVAVIERLIDMAPELSQPKE